MIERRVFRCPYCDRKIESEPIALCCGELHGEWSVEESPSETLERKELKFPDPTAEELDVRSIGSSESANRTRE